MLPALVLFALFIAAGCNREDTSVLERGPRYPDVEGVVQEINFERVLIKNRALRISENIESFTTREHKVTPLLHWRGRYVHVGIRDELVVWIAGIGVVAQSDAPRVYYSGVFQERRGNRAIFKDGTVLRLSSNVEPPARGHTVVSVIDPATDRITAFEG